MSEMDEAFSELQDSKAEKRCATGIAANSYSPEYQAQYRLIRSDKIRAGQRDWRLRNAVKIAESKRIYAAKNKAEIRQRFLKWYSTNHEREKAKQRAYYAANQEECARRQRIRLPKIYEWRRNRSKTDENYRLRNSTRAAIHRVLSRRNQTHLKDRRTLELIGCSYEFLRAHLEVQFRDGMSWANYGPRGWHIDHVIPCALFDLRDKIQLRKCFHFTNLQPLWAEENHRKGSRLSA